MTRNYLVSTDDYSLNELTEKLATLAYGKNVIKDPMDWVIPAFSNLVQSDPNLKGITWAFEYKNQADNLMYRLIKLLNLIER